MPRLRTIKPGFFQNEDLVELDPLACLLFAGLWCWADRDGRLEDRPRRLHLEILPKRACDVDDLLAQLHQRGFIVRYAVDGRPLIQILQFARHQNPHIREAASVLPPPPSLPPLPNGTGPAPDPHCASRAGHGEGGGGSGEPAMSHGSWGQGSGERGHDPAASGALRAPARPGGAGRAGARGFRPNGKGRGAVEHGPRGWTQTYVPGEKLPGASIEAPATFELTGAEATS